MDFFFPFCDSLVLVAIIVAHFSHNSGIDDQPSIEATNVGIVSIIRMFTGLGPTVVSIAKQLGASLSSLMHILVK